MAHLGRNAPPIALTLASVLLWAPLAWALPAEAPASEGEAGGTAEDPWAGVKISDAYDYAKCPYCGKKNELRAATCEVSWWSSCGKALPQPSAEVTDPEMVFVPGLGYYKEGTLLEPAKIRKGRFITGLVLSGLGVAGLIIIIKEIRAGISPSEDFSGDMGLPVMAAIGLTAGGAFLVMAGLKKSKPVYALGRGERFEPYERPGLALTSPDPDDATLKVEVTLLSF